MFSPSPFTFLSASGTGPVDGQMNEVYKYIYYVNRCPVHVKDNV
jgi:hypothetical protein